MTSRSDEPLVENNVKHPRTSLEESVSFNVDISKDGPGGWVTYSEDRGQLKFEWEFAYKGISIRVPNPQEWDRFCDQEQAEWGKGRREEILGRLAEAFRSKQAKNATVRIDDDWIQLAFADSFLASLLDRVLGNS